MIYSAVTIIGGLLHSHIHTLGLPFKMKILQVKAELLTYVKMFTLLYSSIVKCHGLNNIKNNKSNIQKSVLSLYLMKNSMLLREDSAILTARLNMLLDVFIQQKLKNICDVRIQECEVIH